MKTAVRPVRPAVRAAVAATGALLSGSTRERVGRLLLERGPATAAALAEQLGLTTAGVRRHLDAMVAAGDLHARDPRPTPWRARRRGRPARVYALSDIGHDRAPHAYDELAADVLRFVADRGAVADFAEARARELQNRYAGVEGTAGLADALSQDGYAATVHDVPSGTQICQHHCPVAHVAVRYPQLCEAETTAIGRLLGQHVQRLATIAHGDGVCTTHIPAPAGAQRASATTDRKARS